MRVCVWRGGGGLDRLCNGRACDQARWPRRWLFRLSRQRWQLRPRPCLLPHSRLCLMPHPRLCLLPHPRLCLLPHPRLCLLPHARPGPQVGPQRRAGTCSSYWPTCGASPAMLWPTPSTARATLAGSESPKDSRTLFEGVCACALLPTVCVRVPRLPPVCLRVPACRVCVCVCVCPPVDRVRAYARLPTVCLRVPVCRPCVCVRPSVNRRQQAL